MAATCVAARDAVPIAPAIRLSGLLVEDGRLLLVRQARRRSEHWNIPGGHLEVGETAEGGIRREMREETGIDVEVGELLYVTDRMRSGGESVLDLAFLVRRARGALRLVQEGPQGSTDREIDRVAWVPLGELERYGLGHGFAELARRGFPGRGTYRGDFHALYG